MNIKGRILLVVMGLGLISYSLLLLFNQGNSEQALMGVMDKQISATFENSLNRINAMTQLMERNVLDMALVGAEFLALKRRQPKLNLLPSIEFYLTGKFAGFPESIGGGLWFEPFIYDLKKQYFGPYVFTENQRQVFSWDLSTASYDYHGQDWYRQAFPEGKAEEFSSDQEYHWSQPYFDQAGTMSLMMTVAAYMRDPQHNVVGLATVDWSISQMTQFVEAMNVTEHSFSFLIDAASRKFVANTQDTSQTMVEVNGVRWSEQVLADAEFEQVNQLEYQSEDGEGYTVYFIKTRIGMIFGTMVPQQDFVEQVNDITRKNLHFGLVTSVLFSLVMFLVLQILFRPFDRVLELIHQSIQRSADSDTIEVREIPHQSNNEFSPIISALNQLYLMVNDYTHQIERANQILLDKQDEIEELNLHLEEKITKRTHELETKTREALNAYHQLKSAQEKMIVMEKHAALGQLVAGVAHEINTPVGVCVTATSFLREQIQLITGSLENNQLSRKKFAQFVSSSKQTSDILLTNLSRAAELIESFKKVSVDQSSEERRHIYLAEYLQDIIRSLKPKIKHTQHQIKIQCDPEIEMLTYPGAIAQIITNLLLNSLKHGFESRDHGVVSMEVSPLGTDKIRLIYQDDGVGMSQHTLKKLFEPFYTTKRGGGGTGLGMHIVLNIVTQQLQGSIHCESQEQQGVKYFIELPLTCDQSEKV